MASRVVFLHGPGGSGKTYCMTEVVLKVVTPFPGRPRRSGNRLKQQYRQVAPRKDCAFCRKDGQGTEIEMLKH